MNRVLTLGAASALCAAAATGQCFTVTGNSITAQMTPTAFWGVDDEGISPEYAFNGFSFPLAGQSWTHFAVSSNGEIYLTDGTGVQGLSLYGLGSLAGVRGQPGDSPRIMAYASDLVGVFGLTSWDILVDDTVPNQVKVTWTGVNRFLDSADFSMSATLFASGGVRFDYADEEFTVPLSSDFIGVSAGDAVGTGSEPSQDLAAGADSGATALLYQNTWTPFGLPGTTILVVPNGAGGYVSDQTCGGARHTLYGDGCYSVANESFYQTFADAVVASSALQGNAMTLAPTADGYTATWLSGLASSLYLPPSSSATLLPVGNDGQETFTPSAAFPSPFGPVSALRVQGNGIVAFGAGAIDTPGSENWDPSPVGMLAGARGGIYSWHAYNEEEGGDVWGEEVNGVVYITFEDVENFPNTYLNPSTFQVQFEMATGQVTIVWTDIDTDATSPFGSGHLIGWTSPGPSNDPGSIDLATQLPVTTFPDVDALALYADPVPVSTAGSGTTVVFTVENAPELAPGGGVAAGVVMFDDAADPGLDLGSLGAPGCAAYLGDVTASFAFVGPVGAQTVSLTVPAGFPAGVQFFAQAAALSPTANALGLLTSNGVESRVDDN